MQIDEKSVRICENLIVYIVTPLRNYSWYRQHNMAFVEQIALIQTAADRKSVYFIYYTHSYNIHEDGRGIKCRYPTKRKNRGVFT
jgi:hypothetical protein